MGDNGPNARRDGVGTVIVRGDIDFSRTAEPIVSVIVVAWGPAPHLFDCLTSLCAQRATIPFEIVLLLNDVAPDVADAVTRRVRGAIVLESRANLGFAGSVNVAAGSARGDLLIVVHDDVEVPPEWLDELVGSAATHREAEVIGCAVHSDPPSVAAVERPSPSGPVGAPDGSEMPGGAPSDGEPVDVSDCAFLVRRATWDRLGGLQEIFHPFGFVTADLCARVLEAGGHVHVETQAVVRRRRSRRTGDRFRAFVLAVNGELFARRHFPGREVTEDRDSSQVRSAPSASGVARPGKLARGESRPGGSGIARCRVLVIDDAVPDPSLGAGSGRMADVARELVADGRYPVDLLPFVTRRDDDRSRARALGVEVIDQGLEELLGPSGRHYGIVIVSRPHNWTASIATLRRLRGGVPVVYDAEALFHRRLERQLRFVTDAPTALRVERNAAELAEVEREIAAEADYVVAISEEEAEFFRENSPRPRNVVVHPPFFAISNPTPAELGARRGIGFVAGWSAGPDSPNADALAWFARQVLPKVRARAPGSRLRVTGDDPPATVRRLVTPAIEFVGQVERLEDFYGSVRVIIVPLRYGSGVKLKTVEAVQYGVPTVATTVGAEGIDLDEPGAVLVVDEPEEFAASVVTLLVDDAAWRSQRGKALAQQASWAARPAGSIWPSLVADLVAAGSADRTRR